MLCAFNTSKLQKALEIKKKNGFTLIELMVGVSILGILATIAIPSFNALLQDIRVDNKMSELQRALLTARNTAVNTGQFVILCPLDADNLCTTNWNQELSVFIDLNNDLNYDPNADINDITHETLIRTIPAIEPNDQLTYSLPAITQLRYARTGILSLNVGAFANGDFSYCPNGNAKLNQAVIISASGRASVSIENAEGIHVYGDNTTVVTCP